MKKRGAMELSVGTIVVIVLAMSMLILGLVLVKNIFEGSKYNIDVLNQGVKDELTKIFPSDEKIYVHLPNHNADIPQGKDWGVGFAIRNNAQGSPQDSVFSYKVVLADERIQEKCGVGADVANKWIVTGESGRITISPGQIEIGVARFQIPDNAPLCTIRYNIIVDKTGVPYATGFFDVSIK